MKKKIINLVLAMVFLSPFANHAGVPVIDPSNLAQAVQMMIKMTEQVNQLKAQVNQMKSHIESIKGATTFGTILNLAGKEMHDIYPDFPDTINSVNDLISVSGEFKQEVLGLRNNFQNLKPQDIFGDRESITRTFYDERSNELFSNMALNNKALKISKERKKVYEGIRSKIPSAITPKEKQDLLLTMNAELLQLINSLIIEQQLSRKMLLSQKNTDLNNWARKKVIKTKMSDVGLKGE